AIGWAMGVERLVALYAACGGEVPAPAPQVYIVTVGAAAERLGFTLSEQLRDALPQARFEQNLGGGSFKSQLKRADKSGALYALILGDEEVASGQVALKPLRSDDDQVLLAMADVPATLQARL
ncbi:MAG: His/Gly/Thr/Pro-type tRNA ligase C-terminal domain-containing protein, partial [Woeseia sp.]